MTRRDGIGHDDDGPEIPDSAKEYFGPYLPTSELTSADIPAADGPLGPIISFAYTLNGYWVAGSGSLSGAMGDTQALIVRTFLPCYPARSQPASPRPSMPCDDPLGRRPAMREWYYLDNQTKTGPVPEGLLRAKLARGEIDQKTWVWTEGMPGWQLVELVEGTSAEWGAVASCAGASRRPHPRTMPARPVEACTK